MWGHFDWWFADNGTGIVWNSKAAAADELRLCQRISGNNKYSIIDELLLFTFFSPKFYGTFRANVFLCIKHSATGKQAFLS